MEQEKVLIIDDSEGCIIIAKFCLSQLDYAVHIANNGDEGLSLAQSLTPDLILLDLNMPGMNGFEVCRKLKSDELTRDIPVIFLTSSHESDDIVKGFETGAVDYICKPYNSKELTSRVRSHLELKNSREELIRSHLQIQEQMEVIFNQEKLLLEQKNLQIQLELDAKSNELTSTLLQLVKFSEVMNSLLNDLESLTQTPPDNLTTSLRSTIHSYRLQLGLNNWKEFETRFVGLHNDFNKNLQTNFPDLTNNELRLCAFLRLNMNTKDISSITLQTEEGIKKARYRLRKKLGLSEGDNLTAFLSKF
ncbi:MAG: response regulator [Bacteroidota bacterium]|nr:response regulator [Bacteroidota bacterium]